MAIIFSPETSSCRCVVIIGQETILRCDDKPLTFYDIEQLKCLSDNGMLFEERQNNLCVLGLPPTDKLPDQYHPIPLRTYFATYGEALSLPHFRAKALYEWLDKTRFCTRCGSRLEPGTTEEETSLVCPECHATIYPRIEPCIIVLVNRGNEILLALHRQRTTQYYSCLAGFMEAGESAEQAVRREIMEETGISVRNIRYFGSQSWPFPSQLMLGFTAEYESGEIHIQESELQRAAWFPRDNCPATPPKGSIAYSLIHGE
jgi:NAD+ diphosphatase